MTIHAPVFVFVNIFQTDQVRSSHISRLLNSYNDVLGLSANAQTVFRLGTGGTGGTYFPIGSIIAEAISGPVGIDQEGSFHIPDFIAIAQRGTGSESNVVDISQGLLEGGLAQADIVHWSFNSSGPFVNEPALSNLRGLATLYLESVHLIARIDANISGIKDLKNKRVSLDEQGSGTRLDVLPILAAHGVTTDLFEAVYLKPADAMTRLQRDELDAFFIIAGYPVTTVSNLIDNGQAEVVPISGVHIDSLVENYPFFSKHSIPENTYKNTGNIQTIAVPAQLIINSSIDEELAYYITKMLWSRETMQMLSEGHPKGSDVRLDAAMAGMNIPLHPGAKRFYQEQGMLSDH